jgi:ParB family chromosome partitioning protein
MSNPNETLGTLEHLDPNALELDGNVRTDARLTKAFVASIAENGVLQPITAVRVDGKLWVRTGQRRTLAARQAGLPSIPVYVTDGDQETDAAPRLVTQIVENDQRDPLTTTERVVGIQQILETGLSLAKTAKKLSVTQKTVKAAQAVASSQAAIDALDNDVQLTLDEAAVIAEFDDDENAVERLLRNVGRGGFEHLAAQLRQERADYEALAGEEARWAAQGYTVLVEMPNPWDTDCVDVNYLVGPDGTPFDHQSAVDIKPEHWAVLLDQDSEYVDKDTDEPVNDRDVDWNTQGQPNRTPRTVVIDGEQVQLRHADTVVETPVFLARYFCINLAGAGLKTNERFAKYSGQQRGADSYDAGAPLGDEKASKQAAEANAREEAEKRERRKVLALNRLGDAALNVRRQFVAAMLSRKTPPKGAAMFVARCLAADSYLLNNFHADEITAELFGVKPDTGVGKNEIERLVQAADTDGRAQVITLGLVLGALEARTPKDAWRGDPQYATRFVGCKQYLGFLAENGYTVSPVEEAMMGKRKADKVYDQHLAEKDA